ncbi:HI0074 family nucleotidyltransferase substrate-binding subunit [Hydrogenivirga sp. 128-5-R1-1]|uniref:HI0074 family nucleotidyltransferase substrate-binding subunit n=1 Tax=Hydrogenivirga sp. 128-5-R1-1 TaxID=392423 RepID=UPI00015F1944|nr:HI0074 family nucleotidyltransferase substrate-binding subunit [Hydrogenivirga sp. 128-5-R1-1]EDP74087.1 hypothetical protein HG1285_07692 [Hydrogenivirga sp. 128-5-R1-1]
MAYRERFLKKLDQTKRAFEKLKEIENLKDELDEEILYEVAAKRFEYTFETLWKTLKLYLQKQGIECNSPLRCFKEFYKIAKLNPKYEEHVPKIIRLRNEVVHIYDFQTAKFIYDNLEKVVIPVFQEILNKLRQEDLP